MLQKLWKDFTASALYFDQALSKVSEDQFNREVVVVKSFFCVKKFENNFKSKSFLLILNCYNQVGFGLVYDQKYKKFKLTKLQVMCV